MLFVTQVSNSSLGIGRLVLDEQIFLI